MCSKMLANIEPAEKINSRTLVDFKKLPNRCGAFENGISAKFGALIFWYHPAKLALDYVFFFDVFRSNMI